jgi:hypothetical protein
METRFYCSMTVAQAEYLIAACKVAQCRSTPYNYLMTVAHPEYCGA